MKKWNVSVIGGGTGTYTLLKGIRSLSNIDITAIVTSADSGGSTGILRDEFGVLPVGDFRQCIVALADEEREDDNILRKLFEYRFSKGGHGLEGHNFGNLFITALTEVLGSQQEAFTKVSEILNIKGKVFPVTFDKIQLCAEYSDGTIAFGEKMIDDPPYIDGRSLKIKRLWVQPNAQVYEQSKNAILNSDLIILGPGDLYTSILANVVVDGFSEIINKSKSKLVYIPNLMSKYGQTDGFTANNYVEEMEKYLRRTIDFILLNTDEVPFEIQEYYKEERAYPTIDDLGNEPRVIRGSLMSDEIISQSASDKVKRSVLRHSSYKLGVHIEKILDILM